MKNEIGLKNIALELNLSIAAVSRALNDADDISEETKTIVREKAIEKGYMPIFMMKNIKMGPTKSIAIIVDSLKSPYFGMIIELLIEELKKKGYRAIIIPTNSSHACKENIQEALQIRSDAIITFLVPNKNAYEIATLQRTPILLFGRYHEYDYLNVVYMNDRMGGEYAFTYLLNHGCKKLCYVGFSGIECNEPRKQGFTKAAEKLHMEVLYVEADELDQKMPLLIKEGYDGFFCFDDQLASFVINYKRNENIKVIGFNGTSRFYNYAYDITSIEADYSLMSQRAVEILLEQISKDKMRKKVIEVFDVNIYEGKS